MLLHYVIYKYVKSTPIHSSAKKYEQKKNRWNIKKIKNIFVVFNL